MDAFDFWCLCFGFSLLGTYTFLINQYLRAWKKCTKWHLPKNWTAQTKVSILIPARNEAKYIEACLQSILQQQYPKELIEILVINDHSTDKTAAIVKKMTVEFGNITLINLADNIPPNTQSYKKAALDAAIAQAKGELMITTDADCTASPLWLAHIVSFYETKDVSFIAAPVNFYIKTSLLEKFQALDYIGMMLITGAGIHGQFSWMCNGANLAYSRELFYELNGFEGIDHLASGDDMLLMQKVAKAFPNKIGFVKSREAVVFSHAKTKWSSFMQQRLRWAGKTGAYQQKYLIFTQSLVFLYCASIIFSGLAIVFYPKFGVLFLLLVLGKAINDFFLLREAAHFFNAASLMKSFPFTEWIHTFYIFLVGSLSVFVKRHEWKGRKVK